MAKRRIVECRNCKNLFAQVLGIKQYDHRCCSERCFITIGPMSSEMVKNTSTAAYDAYIAQMDRGPKPKKLIRIARRRKQKMKNDLFYKTKEWKELRYLALVTLGRVCSLCQNDKGQMQVDHIKPRSLHPHLALSLSNLQILCKECNQGKSNKFENDFRTATQITLIKKQSK